MLLGREEEALAALRLQPQLAEPHHSQADLGPPSPAAAPSSQMEGASDEELSEGEAATLQQIRARKKKLVAGAPACC